MDTPVTKATDSFPAVPGILRVAVGASVLAGLIHYAVIPEHRAEWWLYAVFFTLLGAFQIVWAGYFCVDDRRALWWLGLAVNAATLALWAITRTTGLPFGPDAGEAEAVEVLDVISGVAELIVIATLLSRMRLSRPSP
jgi:hypothetical protein